MNLKPLIYLVLPLLILGCDDDNDTLNSPLNGLNQTDYLIFGHYYGFCQGEDCVVTYKLTSNKLYEDTKDPYGGSGPFNFVLQPGDQFDIAKHLRNKLPARLLQEKDQTFGCPDCADQGGLFIQVSIRGSVQTWRLDQNERNVPGYLHDFMESVNDTIWELKGWE